MHNNCVAAAKSISFARCNNRIANDVSGIWDNEPNALLDVQLWIGLGVVPWVWEKPPGFKVQESDAAVITRITISEGRVSVEDRAAAAADRLNDSIEEG